MVLARIDSTKYLFDYEFVLQFIIKTKLQYRIVSYIWANSIIY